MKHNENIIFNIGLFTILHFQRVNLCGKKQLDGLYVRNKRTGIIQRFVENINILAT